MPAIAPAEGFEAPEGAVVVPAAGKFLIPGLWDMHVHHEWNGQLDLELANGVTGVRDLNSEPLILTWRDEIRAGKRLGPRIVASGKYLDGQPPNRRSADTPEQARELVRERKRAGADLIKVYSGLSPDAYRAVIDEAGALGLTVAGHCPERVSAFDASRLGQRSIEHLGGVALSCARDEAALREELALAFGGPHGYDMDGVTRTVSKAMADTDPEKRADLFRVQEEPDVADADARHPAASRGGRCPARLKYMNPGFTMLWDRIRANDPHAKLRETRWAFARETVSAMNEAGVPLLAGTDAGGAFCVDVIPGFSLADELELLVDCGLTPAEALRTATLNPALYLGEEATAGTVGIGKRADLVLLHAEPLADIGHARQIAGVMANGTWLPRAELDKLLAGAAAFTPRGSEPTRPVGPNGACRRVGPEGGFTTKTQRTRRLHKGKMMGPAQAG